MAKAVPPAKPMQLVKASLPDHGMVLDYLTINGSKANFTFQSDTTYEITGNIYLNGTCTIEGGAVLKFSSGGIDIYNGAQLVSTAGSYHMAVLTSVNDNSVGQSIGTGSPTIGGTYLAFDLNGSGPTSVLNYLRFEYASVAVSWMSGDGVNVAPLDNCQFLHCGTVVTLMDDCTYDSCNNTLVQTFENVLVSQCSTVVQNAQSSYYAGGIKLVGQDMTVDQVTSLIATYANDYYVFGNSGE